MGERIGWLDTARAIGIVAVVVGHVTTNHAIWAAVFHFHMPLFFMLSGMLARPAPPRAVAARRAGALLLPYAVWLLVLAVADIGLAAITGHPTYLPWDRPVAAVARAVLGGTFLVGPFGTFWFVTCLFCAQVVASMILRRSDRDQVLIAAALFLVAHLMGRWPSPWGMMSVPLGLFFVVAGALYGRHVAPRGWPVTLAALAAASLAFVSAPLDIKIADVGTPVLSVVAALGLCHLVMRVAQRLPSIPLLAAIGQASLVVMYVHLTILYALRDRLPEAVVAFLAIVLPTGLWLLLRRFDLTRQLLLGERVGGEQARPSHTPHQATP